MIADLRLHPAYPAYFVSGVYDREIHAWSGQTQTVVSFAFQGAVADAGLHDVRGVWIGDASAMPTSPAVNPMITTMALARRTAYAMAGEAGST